MNLRPRRFQLSFAVEPHNKGVNISRMRPHRRAPAIIAASRYIDIAVGVNRNTPPFVIAVAA
ncbi:MAG: hypothetical protein BWY95_01662 [Bacteroidetes bacterium ADurb.BinA104]|nr:MAG: hypothetical protein BWY95_01662 [Bacteroidetes bacterium ADurb.BinA104]